jgi:hypothetical protein
VTTDHSVDRRVALRRLAAGAVGAATSTVWVDSLTALAQTHAQEHAAKPVLAAKDWAPRVLTARQNDAVVALSELIIPETETPGAKAARVNRFIDNVLFTATPGERDEFLSCLAWMDARCQSLFGADIASATAADQVALLKKFSDEQTPSAEDRIGFDFFRALKSMTISGYYSSEIGLKQELGDDGQLFLAEFRGCDHPEHQG